MTEMIKETFSVTSNPNTGLRLVKKTKDTLIKNRQSNEKGNVGGGGCMIELENNHYVSYILFKIHR